MNETTENVELVTLITEEDEEQQKSELQRFTKKRSKLKKWIIIALVLAAAVGGYLLLAPKPQPQMQPTQVLEKQKLANTVSLTGTIESADEQKVYTKATGMVQQVNVKVGDRVEAGEVLAQLDTEDLQLTIAGQQAELARSAKVNQHNLSISQKKLDNAVGDIDTGLDTNLISAENSLKNAQQNLNEARLSYNDVKDSHTDADDELDKAEKDFYRADDAFSAAKIKYDQEMAKPEGDRQNVDTLKKEMDEKEDLRDKANTTLVNAQGNVSELSKERVAYRSARVAYENALSNKNAIDNAAKQQIDSLEDGVTSSELAADETSMQISLKKLQKQLDDSTLVAPISGTVTAVYAKEGEPASAAGPMFVIENTDSLVIKTALKEYDVATVTQGMTAEIKTDATGDNIFEGEVSHIDPTAAKGSDGSVKTSGVEFATDINIISQEPALRVGMNVRVNVVTAEKENVYAVPFDTVTMNEKGEKIIYTTKTDAEGKITATAVPVTTGLETNFYLEIMGDGLSDGMVILTSPMGITEGMQIAVAPPATPAASQSGGGAVAAVAVG